MVVRTHTKSRSPSCFGCRKRTLQILFCKGKELYKYYFANLNQLRTQLFEINTWDAGFWQIRNVLHDQNLARDLFKTLKEEHDTLRRKLLPQIFEYEFIPKIDV